MRAPCARIRGTSALRGFCGQRGSGPLTLLAAATSMLPVVATLEFPAAAASTHVLPLAATILLPAAAGGCTVAEFGTHTQNRSAKFRENVWGLKFR